MHGLALKRLVHRLAALQAAHPHRVARRRGQRGNAQGAFGTVGGLHHRDAAQRLAALRGLADEQVHVRLQEAAGAELNALSLST